MQSIPPGIDLMEIPEVQGNHKKLLTIIHQSLIYARGCSPGREGLTEF